MNIAERLASSLGRRDQNPNKELAKQLAQTCDIASVHEITALIRHEPKIELLADALKVLEVIGEANPQLASPSFDVVFPLLYQTINNLQWRAMSVLSNIAHFHQDQLFIHLSRLLEVMDQGSVVTRDNGFKILVVLYQNETYQRDLAPVMAEQVLAAPDNQLGQYAEKWLKVIQPQHVPSLTSALESRLPDLTSPSHQQRIQRILLKLYKLKRKAK